jgi:hypothetical protein
MQETERHRRREKVREYIDANRKSPVAGAIFALIWGPFGCIYSNPMSTVFALLAALALGLIYWPLIGLVWIACVVLAPFQVRTYNARMRRGARYNVT